MPFLAPILKLNGISPIVIEMRKERPIVLIQRPYTDMEVLLTVAPRVEAEDDR